MGAVEVSGPTIQRRESASSEGETLDLRIDHLRQATPKMDVICRATCERITTHIAFVRAVAHQGDPNAPFAMVAATFMIFREGQTREPVRPDGSMG